MFSVLIGSFFLNLLIAWYNARIAGESWDEAKVMGSGYRILVWCLAIESALGFACAYLAALSIVRILPPPVALAVTMLNIVLLLPALIVFSFTFLVQSATALWRMQNLRTVGTTAWNAAMSYYNASRAKDIPKAFRELRSMLQSKDGGKAVWAALAVVLLALGGGAISTWLIIRSTARKHAEEVLGASAGMPAS